MGRVVRKPEINRRRRRRAKYAKLKKRIQRAKGPDEIAKLIEKFRKINPFYPIQSLSASK